MPDGSTVEGGEEMDLEYIAMGEVTGEMGASS